MMRTALLQPDIDARIDQGALAVQRAALRSSTTAM
jgi:hypothetical protein